MRKTSKLLFLFLALMLLTPTAIFAYETKAGTSVFISDSETIEGSLYTAGQNITIDGNINGDLICGAQTLLVNGNIDGDIICAAQSIVINGDVSGNIRLAGETISVNGKVTRNANLFGMSLSLGPEALVERDLFLAGAFANISGKINQSLHGAISAMDLNAEVGKDVKLRMADQADINSVNVNNFEPGLRVSGETIIGGNLYYTATNEGTIESGATIKGDKGYSKTKIKNTKNDNFAFIWNNIYKIFAALMIGLVLISLFRKPIVELLEGMKNNKAGSIGRGAILMFVTPFIVLILIFTLIGAPLALLILIAWLVSFCLAKILIGIFLGQELIKSLKSNPEGNETNPSLIYSMIVGVSIVQIISSIPVLGWLFATVAIWWGLGGMWLYSKKLASGN